MAMSNRDRVGRGLEILAAGLGPFVDARMAAAAPVAGTGWRCCRPGTRPGMAASGSTRGLIRGSCCG